MISPLSNVSRRHIGKELTFRTDLLNKMAMTMGSQQRNSCEFEFQDSWIPTFILPWRIKVGIQKDAIR